MAVAEAAPLMAYLRSAKIVTSMVGVAMLLTACASSSTPNSTADTPTTSATAGALTGALDDWLNAVCAPGTYITDATKLFNTEIGSGICKDHRGLDIIVARFASETVLRTALLGNEFHSFAWGNDDVSAIAFANEDNRWARLDQLSKFGFVLVGSSSPTPPRPERLPPPSASAPTAAAPDTYARPTMVRTTSGKVRCMVTVRGVTCQRHDGGAFPGAPIYGGYPANQASISDSGAFQWISGQLPAIAEDHPNNDTVLTYQNALRIHGWTIEPTPNGTTFTNSQTKHGMFVSAEQVSAF